MQIDEPNISNTNEKNRISINKISVSRFVFLTIITFGLYEAWWIYKSWCFFRDKENSNIKPAIRTILSIIFLIPLFIKIIRLSKNYGYRQDYYSILLFVGYLISWFLSQLPEPYFLISIFSFVFLIPPFKALNYAIDHCDTFKVNLQKSFNIRQIFLIIIGGIFWIFVILSFFKSDKSTRYIKIPVKEIKIN